MIAQYSYILVHIFLAQIIKLDGNKILNEVRKLKSFPDLSEVFNRSAIRGSYCQKFSSHRHNTKIKAQNINNFSET